nr:hypothetical protein [Tanacetum cinerariifolium]
MTRILTNELFTPHKEPEREFRSSSRHFKTLSIDELRSPDFNLLSNQEYSKKEITETMAETMEQYMSKNLSDYGSGVARPKIENKDNFEPNGQFLKELRTNTFSDSDHEDVNEHIEKVLEIEVILFYNGLGITTRQILDSIGAIPSKTIADAKIAIQEIAEYSHKLHNGTSKSRRGGYKAVALGFYQRNNVNPSYQEQRKSMEDTLSKFMSESTKRHEENFNLIKEIRALTDASIRNQGASIKTLEIQIRQVSKVLWERRFGSLPSSTEANLRDQVKSISTTIEADSCPIRRIRSSQYAISTGLNLLENMDAYRDEGMGDVIVGKPFLREVGIKSMRFEGTISLYKDDKNVTYQTVRSHPRFKRHTNEQCNKIPPLLKVSDDDMINGISHPYKKLEGFYKGVLYLGPDYIRDARTEEWLTRGHISVHEME